MNRRLAILGGRGRRDDRWVRGSLTERSTLGAKAPAWMAGVYIGVHSLDFGRR